MTREELIAAIDAYVSERCEQSFKEGQEAALESINQKPSTEEPVEPVQEQVPEYSLENSAVAGFMADQTYYAPGFATSTGLSVVDEYIKGAKEGKTQSWTEQQAKVPIAFDSIEGVDIMDGICNLIPGRQYTYYKTVGGSVIRGKFKTKPNTVRMITMADADPVVNIRDLGGYRCQGGHVAYGKVIRSATLNQLTKECTNAKILKALGVTDEISFSSSNPARTDLGLWSGANFAGIDAYKTVVTKSTQWAKLKSIFKRILKDVKNGGCVLMHCYAGTDRTGTVSAFLLGLLGVCEGDIIKEWEDTSFSCWFNRVRISDWETREMVRKECPEGMLRELFKTMKATFGKNGETFQQQCEAFFTQKVGLTAQQIADLKKALVTAD